MKTDKKLLLVLVVLLSVETVRCQTYPSYGPEINVTINGLTFDAMEPFISPDGNYLFFNNLNDGINTKLYYALKVNDSTFNLIGEINGTNQPFPPHLDAVADMDSLNNFYWTSTRNYPAVLENLFHGKFSNGNVTNIGRVYGNFNKNIPGWLVMDHSISYDGQFLYFNNARFDGDICQGVCETEMGIAEKVNDSTFNKLSSSDFILQNIVDTNYNYYAPCISRDNLELYYTRYPRDSITLNTLFEICVAVRTTPADRFSIPKVLFSALISELIEAPTLTYDKQIIYYHKKTFSSHKIVMRYRQDPLSVINQSNIEVPITVFPNPSRDKINIKTDNSFLKLKVSLYTILGELIKTTNNQTEEIDISFLPAGAYFMKIESDKKFLIKKIIKID